MSRIPKFVLIDVGETNPYFVGDKGFDPIEDVGLKGSAGKLK